MKVKDWIQKLDDFLKTSEKEILDNSWSISHKKAIEKAKEEFQKYRKQEMLWYNSDYDEFIETTKKISKD